MNRTIVDGIDWVGKVDWNLRDFHGHETRNGTTYNAYLVRDEKTALIDTVKAPYADELIEAVSGLADPGSVDYVICNHAEPDHAGALSRVLQVCSRAVLVCTAKCRAALEGQFETSGWKVQVVKDGDALPLGRRSLVFAGTPMAHWPDSTATWVPEDRLLFSMDAFGQHYTSSRRMDEEEPVEELIREAKVYYANILMPFSRPVAKALSRVRELDPAIIAPSHGAIWHRHRDRILDAYDGWSRGRLKAKVLVVYDTMWGSTERMAQAVWDGAAATGVEVQLLRLAETGLTRLATEALDAAAVAVGSPCLNGTIMPRAAALLAYWKGLTLSGRCGLAFGSRGWGGKGGAAEVHERLSETGVDILREPIGTPWAPAADVLEACREAGEQLARAALERASAEPASGAFHDRTRHAPSGENNRE